MLYKRPGWTLLCHAHRRAPTQQHSLSRLSLQNGSATGLLIMFADTRQLATRSHLCDTLHPCALLQMHVATSCQVRQILPWLQGSKWELLLTAHICYRQPWGTPVPYKHTQPVRNIQLATFAGVKRTGGAFRTCLPPNEAAALHRWPEARACRGPSG
jgi:hypothetical protein